MSALNAFGLLAVCLMVFCYSMEQRHHAYVLGFALSCALGSAYGFMQGAWPFGLAEGFWCVVAARKWAKAFAGHAPPDP